VDDHPESAAASGANLLDCFTVAGPRDPASVLALCTVTVLCWHTTVEDVTYRGGWETGN
jgi:hypothetical protein